MAPISPPINFLQSFNDKDFKCLRLTAHCLSDLCISVFYKIISACSWLCCCPGATYYYDSLSNYYSHRGTSFVGTYLKYGHRVLNFSVNTSLHVDGPLQEGVSERKALEDAYGKKRIRKWMRMETEEIPLKKRWLKRRVVNENGSCLGISFESCKKYLQEIEKGSTPYEAILGVSKRYENGASDKADLIQIFGNALSVNKINLIMKRRDLLAKKLGLKRRDSFGFPSVKIKSKEKALSRFIYKLPENAYTVFLTPKEGVGHALVVVKDEEDYYYFDPEQGVIRFDLEELTKQLQEDRKKLGQNACEIAFFSYELS